MRKSEPDHPTIAEVENRSTFGWRRGSFVPIHIDCVSLRFFFSFVLGWLWRVFFCAGGNVPVRDIRQWILHFMFICFLALTRLRVFVWVAFVTFTMYDVILSTIFFLCMRCSFGWACWAGGLLGGNHIFFGLQHIDSFEFNERQRNYNSLDRSFFSRRCRWPSKVIIISITDA